MGAASYLLAGAGSDAALESARHGAGGRSRAGAAHVPREVFVRETASLRVVGPIDPRAPPIARRRDLLAKYEKRVMEEAPYAYKAVEPVVDSVEEAGSRARSPGSFLCTVKG